MASLPSSSSSSVSFGLWPLVTHPSQHLSPGWETVLSTGPSALALAYLLSNVMGMALWLPPLEVMLCISAGRRSDHAAHPLDATREHPLPKVQH